MPARSRRWAVVIVGLVLAALSARLDFVQRIFDQGATQATTLLAHVGLAAPSRLVVAVAPATPQPYVLPNLAGRAHDFGGLILRTLVPNTTTGGGLSLVSVSSGELPLALAHYHEEVEAFYALKGGVEVFHNADQGREVRANDFVLLAPRNVHNYRPVDLDFQLTLAMAPGGIDAFFAAVGAPYTKAGPFDPTAHAALNPGQVLGAMPQYGITPKPVYALNLNWTNGTTADGQDHWHHGAQTLPADAATPYFVASNRGPKFLQRASGQVVAQLATGVQTQGRLSVATLALKPGPKPASRPVQFAVAHAVQVTEGQLQLEMAGATTALIFGDLAFIPAGTRFRYWSTVGFTKFVVWSAGAGLAEAVIAQSEPWTHGVWAP